MAWPLAVRAGHRVVTHRGLTGEHVPEPVDESPRVAGMTETLYRTDLLYRLSDPNCSRIAHLTFNNGGFSAQKQDVNAIARVFRGLFSAREHRQHGADDALGFFDVFERIGPFGGLAVGSFKSDPAGRRGSCPRMSR